MRRFCELPIRFHLLALAIVLTLPALGIILYSGIKERNARYQDAVVETQKLADNLASRQENLITEAQLLGSLLADLPDIRTRNAAKANIFLTSINSKNPQYQSIMIADETGVIWASSVSGMVSVSVADRRYFRRARETKRLSSGEFAIHKVVDAPTISMAFPIASKNGEFNGAIILSYNLGGMHSILQRSQLPADTNYRIFDHMGTIISSGNESGLKVGTPLSEDDFRLMLEGPDRVTGEFKRSDDDQRIFTTLALRLEGETIPYLYIRTTISATKARAAANRDMLLNVALLLPFVAFALLLAYLISKRSIMDRIAILSSASHQIADGNLAVRVANKVEGGELGELGLAFDDMSVKLADDIVRREQSEECLHNVMQRLQLATASGRLGIWDWNPEEDFMVWNDRMFELYGISQGSFTSSIDAWRNALHPDDKDRAFAECLAALNGEKEFETSFRVLRPDGTVVHIKADGIVTRNAEGKAIRMIGINRDITDQKRLEEALEHRLVALTSPLSATSDIIFDDLFDIREIQQIQDAFAAATGVASIITDVYGKPITKPSNFCNLCEQIIRGTEKGLANCYKSDTVLGRMNLAGPTIQPCLSGGLWDGGASIQVGDHHIANWLIGQVLDESCDMKAMMSYAREIGADEDAYRAALGNVTRMSREQFAKVCQALFLIAGQLSRQALQNVQQAKYITGRARAEEALQEEKEKFSLAFQTMPSLLVIASLVDGRYIEVNEAFEQLMGYCRDELIGRCSLDFDIWQNPKDRARVVRMLRTGEKVRNLEIGFRSKSGVDLVGLYSAEIIAIGTEQCLLSLVIDITARKKVEQELRRNEERYRRLYQETPVMLHSIDHDGRLVSVSNYWLYTLGYERSEVLGRKTSEFLTEESRRYAEEVVLPEFFLTGVCKDISYRFVKKNGEIMDTLLSAIVERNDEGKVVRSLAVMIDVTERIRAEKKIEALNRDLVARAIELENVNRELEAFNYSVSHDLRKPLTVIIGYAQIIQELCGNDLNADCQGYLREIWDGTMRMNELIDALLKLSSATSTNLNRETVNLSEIAHEVGAELALIEPDRRVTFRVSEGITVNGDTKLLRIILENLIGNAWKYTANREEAFIEFGMTDIEGGKACFVRDNGAGFDMAHMEKLFTPFQRLPGAAEFKGHGIGLSTVERIIRCHGGRIWAEGEPGKGATFFFTL